MVETTVEELLQSVVAMRDFSAMDMPVKLSFRVKKIMKRVQQDVDSANETLDKLRDKHGKKDDKGEFVHPDGPDGKPIMDQIVLSDPAAYKKDVKELMDTPVKFGFEPLKISELGDKMVVKPAVLFALSWMFEADAEEAAK
jgi:hypothetical protein